MIATPQKRCYEARKEGISRPEAPRRRMPGDNLILHRGGMSGSRTKKEGRIAIPRKGARREVHNGKGGLPKKIEGAERRTRAHRGQVPQRSAKKGNERDRRRGMGVATRETK